MAIKWRKIPDAPWFPLDIYDRELSYEEWDQALTTRVALRWTYEKLKENDTLEDRHYGEPLTKLRPGETPESYADSMFDSFVTVDGGLGKVFKPEKLHKPRWPVAGLNVFEAFYCTSMWEHHEYQEWRELAQLAATDPAEALRTLPKMWRERDQLPDALREAKDTDEGSLQAELMDWRLPLSVDITLDDKTLKLDPCQSGFSYTRPAQVSATTRQEALQTFCVPFVPRSSRPSHNALIV